LELIRINVLGLFINILALVLALVIDEFGVDNTLGIGGVFVLLLIICYYLYVMLKALFSEGFLDQQEKTDIEIIKYKTADDKNGEDRSPNEDNNEDSIPKEEKEYENERSNMKIKE